MSSRRRCGSSTLGLPLWGWSFAAFGFCLGLCGVIVGLAGDSMGGLLAAAGGIIISCCSLAGVWTEYRSKR